MDRVRDLVAATGLPGGTRILETLTGLTWHVLNPLADAQIATFDRLAEHGDAELLDLPGLGRRRLDAIRGELRRVAREQAATRRSSAPRRAGHGGRRG
ncbi:hypothetical protein ACFOWE_31330 [Planomonospora corallina]|uniref:DNA-binding protein n=1 Tax=Planomonospora corallina TaxID=1806052 RepID=A0ABV8IGZ7_9ACTN